MKKYAIILAAGKGLRLGSELAKQFLLLGDKPVLIHTIEAFYYSSVCPEILLVLHESSVSYWKELCHIYNVQIPHTIITGGKERFHSVKNALQNLDTNGYVGIHDAVRPFVTEQVI